MFIISASNQFKKDVKKLIKRGFEMKHLKTTVEILENEGELPSKYKAHKLIGNYLGFLECHIKFDWLLIWKQDNENKEIELTRTGTHSDLFD